MSFLKFTIFVVFLHAASVFAGTINCEQSTNSAHHYDQWSNLHTNYELKPSGLTMTLGENIPDWSVLYTAKVNVGMSTGTCNKNAYIDFSLFTQSPLIGQQGGDFIYGTDTPGIGISVSAIGVNNSPVKNYPLTVELYSTLSTGWGFWATVKYWKIPGEIPMRSGAITVTGPEAAMIYTMPGSSFTSSDPERITSDSLAYISSSKVLTLTMMFQPGTCNVEGDNIKVNMGEYDGSNGHSEWKNASFKLVCPNGMGYNGAATAAQTDVDGYDYPDSVPNDVSISANNKKNGRVQISIIPYTEVVDENKGIIALDGTGAQGYGIQLAWGDYSSQNSVIPANPVILNSYVDANSLNSGFGAGDTPIGGNAFTGTDNTIKMAARYIRTSGETAPGPANAVVQVIANYQ
jgi:hypothetical protein